MDVPGATQHTIEFDLVRLCARTELDTAQVEYIRALVQQEPDWHHLLELATFHRVHPLLHRSLTTVGIEAVPSAIETWLKNAARITAARNLHLVQELDRVLHLLADASIPAISFKGPLLAQSAYGNLGLRACTDLDLLIPPTAFSEVETLLLADAYCPANKVQHLTGLRKNLYLYRSKQFPFIREPMLGLDVHTAIMPPGYAYPVAFDHLLQRSRQVSVGTITLNNIAPEDLLQILCFHGVKNRCETLKYLCDIAEHIRAASDLDWDVVLERAYQMKGERILYLGLHLAHQFLDTALPAEVAARIEQNEQVRHLAAWLAARLPDQMQLGMAQYWERLRFQLMVQPTVANKLRYCLYSLVRQL